MKGKLKNSYLWGLMIILLGSMGYVFYVEPSWERVYWIVVLVLACLVYFIFGWI